ncbi:hypothetical protein [Nitratireductor pacificus]|uniref:Uncharacterized protein n=1 Tax=Nitratireductor pacificus pht-3B TaxID=391937 RepID=K2MJ43_9HYPH|nr:hypothetical protein [Nitratireductor pacificus]EKF17162.1 hypothetical protein NA2_19176 [Nitratireductor pacificus pht-3B]
MNTDQRIAVILDAPHENGKWTYTLRVADGETVQSEWTKSITVSADFAERKSAYDELVALAQDATKDGGQIIPVIMHPFIEAA